MPSPRLSLRPLWFAAPIVFVAIFLVADGRRHQAPQGSPAQALNGAATSAHSAPPPPESRAPGRLLVVIVDSLRRGNVEQPGLMPNVQALARRADSVVLDVETCASNFSLPCIQTIFSGRESPMSSGIEEFAGYGAARRNFVDSAAGAGHRVVLVGNDMLPTLYGRRAAAAVSVASLRADSLAQDLAAIHAAGTYLRDRANTVVILHTPGTDHVTHYDLPGSAGYVKHFHEVDRALASLFAELDPARDGLVVMGDHGHDAEGHHVRASVAIFSGSVYEGLFRELIVPRSRIEQRDLLYLLSYPELVPLPGDYEGRFFATRGAPPPGSRLAAFLDLQRRQLVEAQGPGSASTVAARMNPGWRPGNEKARAALAEAFPLLLCLLLWIAWCYDPGEGWQASGKPALGAGALAAVVWLAEGWGAPPLILALAPALAMAWLVSRRRSARVVSVLALLLGWAAVTASIEPAWRSFFHSRDEFHWGIPLFYVIVLGAGAALAWIRRRSSATWPWGTQLAAFVALPAGVYYYQFDENPFRAYLIPAVLLAAWGVVRLFRASGGRRSKLRDVASKWPELAVPLAAAGLLLIPQDAGGWQWHSWIAARFRDLPPAVSVGACVAIAASLAAMIPSWRARRPFAALVVAMPFYVTPQAGLGLDRFASALVVVLFVGAWLTLSARSRTAAAALESPGSAESAGLMLAAAAVVIALTTCDGLLIDHVDFTFALRYTTGMHSDAARLVTVAPLVALKYAGPLLALLAFHRAVRGARATERAIGFMLLFLVLKMLALLVQALVGALDTGEKFYELAQTDFLFVSSIVIVTALWTLVVWSADLVRCVAWRGWQSMRAS